MLGLGQLELGTDTVRSQGESKEPGRMFRAIAVGSRMLMWMFDQEYE
jgi:hypothetical protein